MLDKEQEMSTKRVVKSVVREVKREEILGKIAKELEPKILELLSASQEVTFEPGDRIKFQLTCTVDGLSILSSTQVLKQLLAQNTNIPADSWKLVRSVPWPEPWKTVLASLQRNGNKPLNQDQISKLIGRPFDIDEHVRFNSIVNGLAINLRLKANKPKGSLDGSWDKRTFNLARK